MILRNDIDRKWNASHFLWALPLLALGIIFSWSVSEPKAEESEPISTATTLFSCDLETSEGDYFVADSFHFDGVPFRSDSVARSGDYSIRLSATDVYGLTAVFSPKDYTASYHLRVWRYNPYGVDSWLVASSEDGRSFYLADKGQMDFGDGWEELHLVFQIPQEVESLKLYCYAGGNGQPVYFDDFKFEITDLTQIADTFKIPQLDIRLSEEGLEKIRQKRDEAWNQGLLVSSDDDWVPAEITDQANKVKAKLRLKGDWLDHLRGTKWSFRIKVKDPEAFWGMKTFNLQRPETRGFIREWIYHKWLDEHGVVTPTYKFVLLQLNGKVLGFYALEEHFEKEIVESRGRREGPILKLNEERFWAGTYRQFQEQGKGKFALPNNKEDSYWAAEIVPFKESTLLDNPDLRKHYERAALLMNQYKYGNDSLSTIFDTEKVGRYLAIIDITGAYHSLTWHNQRWYYNPLSDRLEPIGFDGFTEAPPVLQVGSTFLVDEVFRQQKDLYEPYHKFFKSEEILASYVSHLKEYCDTNYLRDFYAGIQAQVDTYEKLLKEEYFGYQIDWRAYDERARRIRMSLEPYSGHSLLVAPSADYKLLHVTNTHHLPIKIEALIDHQAVPLESEKPLVFPNAKTGQSQVLTVEKPVKTVLYGIPGLDSIFRADVSTWSVPFASPLVSIDQPTGPLLKIMGDQVVIVSGNAVEPIIIPEGYQVTLPEGTALNLTNGAYLLSESPIQAIGSEEHPIRIFSTDQSGAVVIRKSETQSYFVHCHFEQLGRVDRDGYLLTGGVTAYETSIKFSACVFQENTQEDALNAVQSQFHLENCLFRKTAFDAFDADFSTGSIYSCYFQNTGNDAMDFSGSEVMIQGCQLEDIGDKGISAGEDSNIKAFDLQIDRASIGLASKDLSLLEVKNIVLINVGTGFTAFQKKATYGPAEMIVTNLEHRNVRHLHIIEPGSSLILESKHVTAN